MSRSIRRIAAAAALLVSVFLAGCDGRVEVRLSFPTGSEIDELLDAVVHEDRPRIRSLLAPTVRYTYESRSGWGFPRYYSRHFSRYEFADRLPYLFGQGDVVSASFHERRARITNNRMTVTGRLYWTVVCPWNYDSYTVTGILTAGLLRPYGGEWLISDLHFVQTDVHGRCGRYGDFYFDFDFDFDLEFRFRLNGVEDETVSELL